MILRNRKFRLIEGDCLFKLMGLPENSIDTVITDPPYGLKFMGKCWDHGIPGIPFWKEILRVAKPGAMLLAFGGTRTFHRLTCAIEDAGWEVRDCMSWLCGSGFPKSLDISKAIDKAAGAEREIIGTREKRGLGGSNTFAQDEWTQSQRGMIDLPITVAATDTAKQWSGYGTALKPAWEPIIVAMKPLDGTFAENAQSHGVGGFNIDGSRIALNGGYKCGANGRPSQTGLGDKYIPLKANQHSEVGRWPANVLLDEVAAEMLDVQSGTLKAGVAKEPKAKKMLRSIYGATNTLGRECGFADAGGASRFFYTAKTSRKERGEGNNHPTVKPMKLMRYLCKLTKTPTGGIVLDPFMGSGSTGIAALKEGRRFLGIEKDPAYYRIAVDRILDSMGDQ